MQSQHWHTVSVDQKSKYSNDVSHCLHGWLISKRRFYHPEANNVIVRSIGSPAPATWSMITNDEQFHACCVCIPDKLIGKHRSRGLLVFAQAKHRVPRVMFIITWIRRSRLVPLSIPPVSSLRLANPRLSACVSGGPRNPGQNCQTSVSNMSESATKRKQRRSIVHCSVALRADV